MTPNPPAPEPPADQHGRRSFLFGGLVGGAVGLAGGGAAGYAARRPPAQPTAQPPTPAQADPPDEVEAERRAATVASYGQFGEDLVLNSLFMGCNIVNPSYLDIGTYEPISGNNTYLFYGRSRGVLVEPNVELSDKIRRFRPKDTLLVAGIGIDDRPDADYYVMSSWGVNTFDKAQVELMERTTNLRLVKVVKMPLLNINRVIAEQFGGAAPDLISIDIEGLDHAVLKTLDFARFRPKVICVETLIISSLKHNPETPKLLAEKGYELRGMTHPNMIFVDKNLLKEPAKK